VKEQTKEKIDRIVPDGALNEDTRLVLVNAIYLKAPWLFAFQERATQPGVFHKADGTTVDVPMMRHTENLGYLDGDGFVAVSLPYENRDLQFVVLLPDADLAAFEKALTPALLGSVAKLPVKNVNLRLPKFRIEPALLALGDTLKALGMPSAFNVPIGSADFSGIAPRKPDDYLYISDVFHKTFLEIDEKGTEAAAATAAVMMRATSAPLDPVTVTVDRPFFFAVQQRSTGACLFLGRVMDPTAK
jgi:serpin B